MKRVFTWILVFNVLSLVFSSICFSAQIQLRPAETTILTFDQQIKTAKLQSGLNAEIQLENFPNRGIVIITTLETFASGSFHVIFADGKVTTITATVDTTAPLKQSLSANFLNSQPSIQHSTSTQARTIPEFTFGENIPEDVKPIFTFLKTLERYPTQRIRYSGSLPYGVHGMITRIQKRPESFVYELEISNQLSRAINISAKTFSHGLTRAVYIVNMDTNGQRKLKPSERTFVYVYESR